MVRRAWPRFMMTRALMVGCAAGEGYLDDADEVSHAEQAQLLAATLADHAGRLGAHLIVFKEFPANYRGDLAALLGAGFTRAPSFPMTRLDIDYASFDDFMARALSAKTRKDLRVKFRTAAAAPPIALEVVNDISPIIEEVFPLYLQVFERAQFRFEKLTAEFLCELGRRMPDKARFFVWRQQGRVIAFSLCMVQDDEIFGEYLGFDYAVALDLHLYHYVFRDVVTWAMAHGYKTFRSNGASYDPKLHLRFRLDPVDLYVRHTFKPANFVLSRLLPFMVPTRYDPLLRRFPNFHEIEW
jgi:predicted N-acyltransferase